MKRSSCTVMVTALLLWAAQASAGEENRRVLALYDSTELVDNTADSSHTHMLLEMPLNYLGMVVDYHDVNDRPLPDPSGYRAVIAWFGDDIMVGPEEYWRWMSAALHGGTRVLLIGGLGAERHPSGEPTDDILKQQTLNDLGFQIDYGIPFTQNPFVIKIEDKRPEHFSFETKQPPENVSHQRFVPTREDVEVWRSIQRTDVRDSTGAAVAVCPRGALVFDEWCILRVVDSEIYKDYWDLDPFVFLETALDCRDMLRPDVTTFCGARAAYSHIDGDGMSNPTLDVPGPERYCAKVIYEEVLRQRPVPVTVGVIVGYPESLGVADKELKQLARMILALPHVQAGCHGWAHPLDWRKHTVALNIPGYTYSERKETVEAMEYINRELLQDGKRVEIYQWTGDCAPPASALALVEEFGVANINGGDPRLDEAYPSVTKVSPLTRPVGSYHQIYASSTNEYLYTNSWTENYGGFRNVVETFVRSESPRRLLPVNVYYHFFSGERITSLRAVQKVYDWCLKRPLCWIHAAEYTRSVKGFLRARVGRTEEGAYWMEDFAPCNTARLDHCTRQVDMQRSVGVIGFNHHEGSLYVALAPVKRAEIVLCDTPPSKPCLLHSTSLLRRVSGDVHTWKAEARLYAPGHIRLQGFFPGKSVSVRVHDKRDDLTTDNKGVLTISMAPGRGEWVEVTVGP